MKKYLIIAVIIILGIVISTNLGFFKKIALQPNDESVPESSVTRSEEDLEIIANDLMTPWEVLTLPNGKLIVTERNGRVSTLDPDTGEMNEIYTTTTTETEEGGLLGMALHPDFEVNNFVYLYEGYAKKDDGFLNRVVQYSFDGNNFTEQNIIIDTIPGAEYHDGGRIAFGPDGKLYITTGDATQKEHAQDLNSVAGKILRLNPDGSIPTDNPFPNSLVYSYGHRNPQGIAWDENGQLWSTEHGPSGLESGHDELNKIVPGGNYGWPLFAGNEQQVSRTIDRNEYIFPEIESGNDEAWAPAGLTYLDGVLYFGGLRGQALYQIPLEQGEVGELSRLLSETYGRIRTTQTFGDGALYITTSNTDGRGFPKEDDDKIIKINNL